MLKETITTIADLRFNIINRNPNGNHDNYTQQLLDRSAILMRKLLEIQENLKND